jgi:hypothetical protein
MIDWAKEYADLFDSAARERAARLAAEARAAALEARLVRLGRHWRESTDLLVRRGYDRESILACANDLAAALSDERESAKEEP